jgi:hypothetical protein
MVVGNLAETNEGAAIVMGGIGGAPFTRIVT